MLDNTIVFEKTHLKMVSFLFSWCRNYQMISMSVIRYHFTVKSIETDFFGEDTSGLEKL